MPRRPSHPNRSLRLVRAALRRGDRPHALAMGAAIGMFIAFTPLLGIQMLLALLGATVLRVSKAAAVALVWVTNPLTIAPIFALTYWVGTLLVPNSALGATDGSAADGALATAAHYSGAIMVPLLVGGAVVGLLCAVVTYPCVKLAAEYSRRAHRARKHRASRQRVSPLPGYPAL